MKRSLTHQTNLTPPGSTQGSEVQQRLSDRELASSKATPQRAARRARAAMLGIAVVSVGATAGVLLPGQADEAIAAEPSLTNSSLAAESLDAAVLTIEPEADVEPVAVVEPEIVEAIATPAIGPALMQHRVEDGDTLWALAQSYGVPAEAIAASNSIAPGSVLTVGQTLKIPTAIAQETLIAASEPVAVGRSDEPVEAPTKVAPSADADAPSDEAIVAESESEPAAASPVAVSPAWREAKAQQAETAAASSTYRVQSGDTIEAIARRFNVSGLEIAQLNNVSDPRSLQPGQRLSIPVVSAESVTPDSQAPRLIAPTDIATDESVVALQSRPGDSHIEKLKDEVMLLRERIRSERQAASPNQAPAVAAASAELTRRPEPVLLNPTVSAAARSERPAVLPSEVQESTALPPIEIEPERPRVIAVAPVPTEAYNRLLQLPEGRTVAPDLPPLQGPEQYLPDRPQQFNGYIWPARGTLTSGYGPRWGRMHRGIDIAAPTGTPIFAAAAGEIISAGWNNGGYGNLVDIRHPDGSMTRYAHNSRILVRKGQRVKQGEQIALMGSTGFSTGPHLHFEIHPAGRGATNPMAFLPRNRR